MSSPDPVEPVSDPKRIEELFAAAIERGSSERRAFLDSSCSGSPGLRAELDSLIAAHEANEAAGGFLEQVDRERGAALLQQTERSETGRLVGPYRLLREVGRGGMGVVYLAERAEGGFTQRVAIKLVKRGMDSDAILQRFLRERQILAGLDHPNVARLLDGGVTDDGQPYFAMELVDGEPLTEYCDSRRLGLLERLRLFEEACRAVQYAHGRLVIHRDLKPSNMLVTVEGHLKLLDFGVAKLLGAGESATITETGIHPQTPQYASPEQVRGEPVTTATDVYALGLVLYELVTGHPPYGGEGSSRQELERAVRGTDPAPPSRAPVVPMPRSLRGDLDAVALKALRKEPGRRYNSAEAFAEDIRRCLTGQPVQARPDSLSYRTAKFIRRHKVGVGAAAAGTMSLVIGLLGTTWQAAVAARERDHARLETERAEKVKEFLVGVFRAVDPEESKGQEITANELLERGAQRIEVELSGQPALQAELLHTIAASFWSLGLLDRARALEERSLELLRKLHGQEHPQIAQALTSLGGILYGTGDLAGSEDVRRQALAMRRKLLPPDSVETAESLAGLGAVLNWRGKLAEAEPLLREALAIRQKRLGPAHSDTAGSVINLGDLLYSKGEYAAAAELHRQALSLRRSLHGDLHPVVARSLESLGITLQAQGDLAEAEVAHREALSIRRKVQGDDHPRVAVTLHYLASVLHDKGDLQAAERTYREVLALYRKQRGEDQPYAALALTFLAQVLTELGRVEEALPLFERAVAVHGRIADADHRPLARTLEQHAAALAAVGRPREALRLLDKSLAIYRASVGPEHPSTASALAKVAAARAELGDLEGAEGVYRQVLDLRRHASPGSPRAIVFALMDLGKILTRQDRAAEAEPLLREALAKAPTALPAAHWRRGELESLLGGCLWRLERRDEALPLLRSGHERIREALGDAHAATSIALRRLEDARSAHPGNEDEAR